MATEEQIKMAAKLYECRDTARSLANMKQMDYLEMLKPYIRTIKQVMESTKLQPIPALLVVSETKAYEDNGMAQLLFMASVVEIIEPSK